MRAAGSGSEQSGPGSEDDSDTDSLLLVVDDLDVSTEECGTSQVRMPIAKYMSFKIAKSVPVYRPSCASIGLYT